MMAGVRSGQARSGQARTGQVRTGQDRSGQVRSGQDRSQARLPEVAVGSTCMAMAWCTAAVRTTRTYHIHK